MVLNPFSDLNDLAMALVLVSTMSPIHSCCFWGLELKHDNFQPREWRDVLTFPNVVRRSNVTEYYSSLELID